MQLRRTLEFKKGEIAVIGTSGFNPEEYASAMIVRGFEKEIRSKSGIKKLKPEEISGSTLPDSLVYQSTFHVLSDEQFDKIVELVKYFRNPHDVNDVDNDKVDEIMKLLAE